MGELFGLILALSVHSADVTVGLNDEKKKSIFGQVMGKGENGEQLLTKAKGFMEEHGVGDILEIFGFVGELIETLKEQNI